MPSLVVTWSVPLCFPNCSFCFYLICVTSQSLVYCVVTRSTHPYVSSWPYCCWIHTLFCPTDLHCCAITHHTSCFITQIYTLYLSHVGCYQIGTQMLLYNMHHLCRSMHSGAAVLGLDLPVNWGLSVQSLPVLPILAWVSTGYSGFLPQTKEMRVGSTGWFCRPAAKLTNNLAFFKSGILMCTFSELQISPVFISHSSCSIHHDGWSRYVELAGQRSKVIWCQRALGRSDRLTANSSLKQKQYVLSLGHPLPISPLSYSLTISLSISLFFFHSLSPSPPYYFKFINNSAN